MTLRLSMLFAAAAVSALALAACTPKAAAPAAADTSKDSDALKAQAVSYTADLKAKDFGKVAGYYASDAVVMAPDLPVATGIDQVTAGLKAASADPGYTLNVVPDAVAVASSGDMATVMGHADVTQTNAKTHAVDHFTQNYLVSEKKDSTGAWKVEVVAIVKPGAAPAAAATPAAAPAAAAS